MKPYIKAIVAVIGAVLVAVQSAITDDVITSQEWVTIALATVTAIGVYFFENKDPEDEQP